MNLSNHVISFNKLITSISENNYFLTTPIQAKENRVSVHLTSGKNKKEVKIEIVNYDDVKRLFMTIVIINIPYKTVDDFISFDIYLKKNTIEYPEILEGEERTEEKIEHYIKNCSELFKTYGVKLINTDEQFPGYYPEWT